VNLSVISDCGAGIGSGRGGGVGNIIIANNARLAGSVTPNRGATVVGSGEIGGTTGDIQIGNNAKIFIGSYSLFGAAIGSGINKKKCLA